MALPAGHLKTPSLAVGGGAAPSSPRTPRSSPFRRPVSPATPTTVRQATLSASPFKAGQINNNNNSSSNSNSNNSNNSNNISNSNSNNSNNVINSRFAPPAISSPSSSSPATPTGTAESLTPRGKVSPPQQQPADDMFGLPRPRAPPVSTASTAPITGRNGNGNALSQLQNAQVRTLREGFQILDRDSDGVVNREDVTDMLNQLGLPSTATDIARFFPHSSPQQTITLAAFLNSIATGLAALSPSAELLSALSSFDDDDSGQIDVEELRDALLHTAPEPGERNLTAADIDEVMAGFSGKRAFGGKTKGGAGGFGKRADVFRYQEFVNSLSGGGNGNGEASAEEEADD